MENIISGFIEGLPTFAILLVVAAMMVTLSKGADIFVDEAVSLSVHLHIPKMIIGVTIVSVGTTLPEAAVSVMAAIKGNPDLALGNAIGSIITNTALIIGISALIGKLTADKESSGRQGRFLLIAGLLLAIACVPLFTGSGDGSISQLTGFIFIALLIAYMAVSVRSARKTRMKAPDVSEEKSPVIIQFLKLASGAAIIIASSRVLIPAVETTAFRIGIPQGIIAATIVALGTSLPELVTAITAVRKGHGELAVGNIIGADIMNVLFVVGASAAVTRGGLDVPKMFFYFHIPAMLLVLLLFRYFTTKKHIHIPKSGGAILLSLYIIYIIACYVM